MDIIRIGGVSGWMSAAALARAHGLPLSTHLLEYLDVASPLLAEPARVRDGTITAALARLVQSSGETLASTF